MKSLTYIFTKNPQNFDDCLDYARRNNLLGVSLNLETTEIFTVRPVGKQLIAKFDFEFSDRLIRCEKILGGCLSYESEKKQVKIIQAANEKLRQHLEKLSDYPQKIAGSGKRFDETMIYRFSSNIFAH